MAPVRSFRQRSGSSSAGEPAAEGERLVRVAGEGEQAHHHALVGLGRMAGDRERVVVVVAAVDVRDLEGDLEDGGVLGHGRYWPAGRAGSRKARAVLSSRRGRHGTMIVPLTLADFLERAELVYGHREAVVDEPDPPGGGLGRFTYAQFASMARSLAATLDDLGVGESDRVAIVSPNAARFLDQPVRGQRVRARARAGQLPAERGGDPLHHRALRLLGAAGGSRARRVRCATSR